MISTSTATALAPLRISFGGGGTDLAAYYERFGGVVLSAGISRYCRVEVRDARDGGINIHSTDYNLYRSFPADVRPYVEEPLALPKAVAEWFWDRGLREVGAEIFLSSEVPPGTGLGSSSAMAVSLLHALSAYLGRAISTDEAAETASWIEIERLGMPIGKQDQYASAFGGLNVLRFSAEGVAVEPLMLPADTLSALANRLLLFSTGRSHQSGEILRGQREKSATDAGTIESLHRLKALAGDMQAALLAGDLDGFGTLLDQGWRYKKQLSPRISTSDIDRWYNAAREAGAIGGKITGAGGGGYLLLYCPPERQSELRCHLHALGLREMEFGFDMTGARIDGVHAPEYLSTRSFSRTGDLRQRFMSGALGRSQDNV